MKKFYITIFILLASLSIFYYAKNLQLDNILPRPFRPGFSGSLNKNDKILPASVENLNNDSEDNFTDLTFNDSNYRVVWTFVENVGDIQLHPNFEDRIASEEAYDLFKCKKLINAGFYTKENKPIGLFIYDRKLISKVKKSNFINGFFSINIFDTPLITMNEPKPDAKLALQSGPILIENNFKKNISIKNDKRARRSVVATTGSNKVVFLIIYDKDSVFNGPFLKDLPEIIKILDNKLQLNIADALNLDGGSASCFISDTVKLKELTPVGSYFCIK